MAERRRNRGDGDGRAHDRSEQRATLRSWFAEELRDTRNGFRSHMKQWNNERKDVSSKWFSWMYSPLSILVGTVLSIAFLLFSIVVVDIAASLSKYQFLYAVSDFLTGNILLFIGASLFFGLGRYLTYISRESRLLLRPIFISAGLIFAFWMAISVIDLSDILASNVVISTISAFFFARMGDIFVTLLVIGYMLTLLRVFFFYLFW